MEKLNSIKIEFGGKSTDSILCFNVDTKAIELVSASQYLILGKKTFPTASKEDGLEVRCWYQSLTGLSGAGELLYSSEWRVQKVGWYRTTCQQQQASLVEHIPYLEKLFLYVEIDDETRSIKQGSYTPIIVADGTEVSVISQVDLVDLFCRETYWEDIKKVPVEDFLFFNNELEEICVTLPKDKKLWRFTKFFHSQHSPLRLVPDGREGFLFAYGNYAIYEISKKFYICDNKTKLFDHVICDSFKEAIEEVYRWSYLIYDGQRIVEINYPDKRVFVHINSSVDISQTTKDWRDTRTTEEVLNELLQNVQEEYKEVDLNDIIDNLDQDEG